MAGEDEKGDADPPGKREGESGDRKLEVEALRAGARLSPSTLARALLDPRLAVRLVLGPGGVGLTRTR